MCWKRREITSFSLAARTRPATPISRMAHGGETPWSRPRVHPAMSIASDLVEAFSLCPRKAFLLMAGATASPGPHDYEVVVREQAEANRQAHRARLAKAGEVVLARPG